MKFKYLAQQEKVRINNKKGLFTPTDVLFIVLLVITLFIGYHFYITLFGGEMHNDSNVHLFSYELSQKFHTIEVDESRISAIANECKGLNATQIDDYYFIKKHCRDADKSSSTFSILFAAGLMDSMRKQYINSNEFRNYISSIRESKPRCREFSEIQLSPNQDPQIVFSREALVGNSIFVTPTGYYSACSDFIPRRS